MKIFSKQTLSKKILTIIFSGAVIFGMFFIVSEIKAGFDESGVGWLWGGGTETDGAAPWDGTNTNVGWISMNSLNCDANNDGRSDGSSTGCPLVGTVMTSYGVNIPDTGSLSGYAWSGNIGWISFNTSDLSGCPSGVGCDARRAGNFLEGWARIVSIKEALALGNSGGWQGWVKLRGSNYEVSINPDTNKLNGYAWSNELGWIDFSGASILAKPSVTLSASPNPIILQQGESLPKQTTLKWTTGGTISSCAAGEDWSGSKSIAGGSESVDVSESYNSYKLTCDGPRGEATGEATVFVGCYNNSCFGTTCQAIFRQTLAYDCRQSCQSDDQCKSSSGPRYREVAP